MTQHNRETLLSLADRCDRQMLGTLDRALGTGGTAWRTAAAEWAAISASLRARATLEPTGEKA